MSVGHYYQFIKLKMSQFPKYNYVHILGAGDKLVQTGRGTLHTVVINTTSASGVVLYDGIATATNRIATIGVSAAIGQSFLYDIEFSQGLFVSVGGASDITLSIGA